MNEKQTIEAMFRRQCQQFENLSHELKTPIAIIQGRAAHSMAKECSKEINKTLSVIDEVTHQITSIISKLTESTKNGYCLTENTYENCSVSLLTEHILEKIQPLANIKKITLTSTITPDIQHLCNPQQIENLFVNLITNAIKYTPKRGSVGVQLIDLNNEYQFIVEDSGIGIPDAELPLIFRRFYRCSNITPPVQEGSGIGLAVVKEIVDTYKGNIKVESRIGSGTKFIVSFNKYLEYLEYQRDELSSYATNFETVNTNTVHTQSDDTKNFNKLLYLHKLNSSKHKVMIVENNYQMLALLQEQLEPFYNVIAVENGEVAAKVSLVEQPDIVLSDINMPRMDGFRLLDTLKNHPATNHIPVVLLTGKSNISDRIRGFKKSADAYLTKPYDVIELRELLNSLIINRKITLSHAKESDSKSIKQNQHLTSKNKSSMERSIDYIKQNYMNHNLTIQKLAAEASLCERQLLRKFKDTFEKSPRDYLNDYRLDKARPLILQGLKVSEVAAKSGFSSPTYFSKQYKKKFGHPPKNDNPKKSRIYEETQLGY
ncbi:hybrid sensor histidine kinase/response regulator transcription factor [Pleionea sediminis]|uniref:hybrid sensor histidine kinase/response regulator transcription factor n=1 Tax=Pleionea sediminis TaxID=2569479 RepID=UPI0013DDF103|nr:ATP-binding protein [Pleionea sediminis]